jgi:proteasome lid subunit RPN8/RPN11
MKNSPTTQKGLELRVGCDVARQIRQHARAFTKTEVCGVLVGDENDGIISVEACIQGAKSLQAGTHVTFTQDTWEHIYKIKDRDYPEMRIVGWYHSHPGFGVFLSDHDTFIHTNFFSAPQQVAWVYDPHSDEEGCFGWSDEKLERLSRIVLVDAKGGEMAGETGKPEPLFAGSDEEEEEVSIPQNRPRPPETEAQAFLRIGLNLLTYLSLLAIGFLTSWVLFPHYVGIPVDPVTLQPILNAPGSPTGIAPAPAGIAPVPTGAQPNQPAGNSTPQPPPSPKSTLPQQSTKGKP